MRIRCWHVALALFGISVIAGLAQDALKKATRAEGESAAISKVEPAYPPVARQLKIQGMVELEAVVSAIGEVEKVNIVSGNPVLTKPAAEALKKWKFRSFLVDGKAIVTTVPVTFSFRL
ncbi:MAG TPA: energy transducer TonB [Bryobacteraceae bacterium]|nr:energy transducer TonB [Bryobacteraceae bacterium]